MVQKILKTQSASVSRNTGTQSRDEKRKIICVWPLTDTTHAQNQFMGIVAERTEHLFTVYATMCRHLHVIRIWPFGVSMLRWGSSCGAQDGLNHPDDSAYKELGLQTHIWKHPALTLARFGCCLDLKYRKVSETSKSIKLTLVLQLSLHSCDSNVSFNLRKGKEKNITSKLPCDN